MVVAVHRTLDVLLHQIGVDGDRRRVGGAGRRDLLRTRVDDVAGGPHAASAGPSSGVDGDEAGLVDLAVEPGQQSVGVRHVAGPDKHGGSGDDATVGPLNAGQPVGFDHELADFPPDDLDAARLELLTFGRVLGTADGVNSWSSGQRSRPLWRVSAPDFGAPGRCDR